VICARGEEDAGSARVSLPCVRISNLRGKNLADPVGGICIRGKEGRQLPPDFFLLPLTPAPCVSAYLVYDSGLYQQFVTYDPNQKDDALGFFQTT
jgi:hypothetical protein